MQKPAKGGPASQSSAWTGRRWPGCRSPPKAGSPPAAAPPGAAPGPGGGGRGAEARQRRARHPEHRHPKQRQTEHRLPVQHVTPFAARDRPLHLSQRPVTIRKPTACVLRLTVHTRVRQSPRTSSEMSLHGPTQTPPAKTKYPKPHPVVHPSIFHRESNAQACGRQNHAPKRGEKPDPPRQIL